MHTSIHICGAAHGAFRKPSPPAIFSFHRVTSVPAAGIDLVSSIEPISAGRSEIEIFSSRRCCFSSCFCCCAR
jgi:hypothetical protein